MAKVFPHPAFKCPCDADGIFDVVCDREGWAELDSSMMGGVAELLQFREHLLEYEFLRLTVSPDNGLFMPYGRFKPKQMSPLAAIGHVHPLMERPEGDKAALIKAMALVPEPECGLMFVHPGFLRYEDELDFWYFSPDGEQKQRLSHWTVVHLPSIREESLLESWYIKKPNRKFA